jgi:hypothetical protein
VQSYALKNLHAALNHVKLLRNHLGSLLVGGENAQIARDVLIDLVDCSGVDMNALEPLFADFVRDAKTFACEQDFALVLEHANAPYSGRHSKFSLVPTYSSDEQSPPGSRPNLDKLPNHR